MYADINGVKVEFPDSVLNPTDKRQSIADTGRIYGLYSKLFNVGDTVLDIGAYLGQNAVVCALLGAKVHTFEPSANNYERLLKVIRPFRNITPYCKAISDKFGSEKVVFNDCSGQYNASTVEYVILDEYIRATRRIEDPAFVKIDIEGMESIAMWGMSHIIENVRPIFDLELHFDMAPRSAMCRGWVDPENGGYDFHTFEDLKYKWFDMETLQPVKVDDLPRAICKNYLVIPEERLNCLYAI